MSDENVVTEDEMMDKVLSGEVTQEEYDKYLNTIGDNEASQPSGDEDTAGKDGSELGKDGEDPEKSPDEDPEKVVLTKDGKHTIPFEVVEELREQVQDSTKQNEELKTAIDEQKTLIADLQKAQETDDDKGNSDATDKLLGDLEEDYPEAAEALKKMLEPVVALGDKIKPVIEDLEERKNASAQAAAMEKHEQAITELNPRFAEVRQKEEFWKWFDDQPSYVKGAINSTDPQLFADVVSLYDESLKTAVAGTDNSDDKNKQKIADALAKAKGKGKKISSISEIPGSAALTTGEENVDNMTNTQISEKLDKMTLEELEKWMLKHTLKRT